MVKSKIKKKNKIISNSFSDKIFDITNILIMVTLLIIFVFPLWFIIVASFSDPDAVYAGRVLVWVKDFTLIGYKQIFEYDPIWLGYRNNIFYTVLGTVINMVVTVLCAYPLAQKDWLPRKFWIKFCMVPMFFGGGLIPTYLVIKKLGMVDTIWAMLIPGALSFYNALIVRNYFMNSIPKELREASELDGATHSQYLLKVVLPLSKPVLAVVALYYAVGHWNDYYTSLIYIRNEDLYPLQRILRNVLGSATSMAEAGKGTSSMTQSYINTRELALSLKYTTIIAGILPMMIIYPFVQKHFVKGVMIGSIKG